MKALLRWFVFSGHAALMAHGHACAVRRLRCRRHRVGR